MKVQVLFKPRQEAARVERHDIFIFSLKVWD